MTTTTQARMDLLPGEDEISVRESVSRICNSFGDGYQRAQYDAGKPLTGLWRALGEAGFLAANLGEAWGGGGLGMTGMSWVIEECARSGNGGLSMIVSAGMAGTLLEAHGTPAQKQRWLPGIANGSLKFSFAITEPDAGTNSHNLRTEIRRHGDAYVLNGQKTYCSGVEDADAIMVVTRFRHADGKLGKHCLCIMDTSAPGYSHQPIKMPYVAAETSQSLFFDQVPIAADAIVGGEESGLRVVFDGLNPERIAVASVCVGTGFRALEKACNYARQRAVWGQPIGAHQAIAHPLAKVRIELEAAKLLTQKAATLWDARLPQAGEVSNMAKYAAAEAAVHAVDAAIQTHGGNGLANEYGVSDLWWLARLFRIAPVSAEMILNHVAQHSLGLPKSY